jgi:L-ribulose-5-phosphate 4-epimerase
MTHLRTLKERAYACTMQLPDLGLVRHTFGNASAADRSAGLMAIKPSGVPYEDLRAEDMVVVDFENRVVEGKLRPSSDTKTHVVLYRSFPEITGVVHTHSTYAVAWAQAMKPIPILGTTHADIIPAEIPCTGALSDEMIAGEYEEETGRLIVRTFAGRSYQEIPMVIVASHGPFTWGATPEDAVYNSAMLEELAMLAFLTLSINPGAPPLGKSLAEKHYRRKHGPGATYGQGRS